jgi:hypothetical protein
LFRRPFRTKQWPENLNEFSRAALPSEDQAKRGKPAVRAVLACFQLMETASFTG